MRVAVAGGTGVVGRHVTERLRAGGHEPVVLARAAGIDLLTGDGLADTLDGVEAVVDVTSVVTTRTGPATEFFTRTSGNLLTAGYAAGVRHHVLLSIVGIDVDERMERAEVGTVKYAVAEAFRKDPYGVDALVTADMDLRQRLREIRADIQGGRPIAGFAEEMADIVGRLVPQIPRNIVPPQSPENHGTTGVNELKH